MRISAITCFALTASMSVGAAAFAQTPDQTRTAHQDTQFLEKATQGSVDEIDLAQLALKKSTNEDVKAFAQKMVHDHQQLIDSMQSFASEAGLKTPEHADAAGQATKLKLEVLTGATFDKAYIKAMVEDHHKDLVAFLAEEKTTGYPAFKEAVAKGAKVVREHTEMIDQMAKKDGIATPPVPSAGM